MILNSWVFSDDGEPAGTAGKPMLAQLMGSGAWRDNGRVVVRYYGGILLGTGGLVKAYGGGVHQGACRVDNAAQDAVDRIYFAVYTAVSRS